MRRTETSRFSLSTVGDATRIDIHPARPDTAFLAAAALLGGLFGLPALAVLIDPARHDALSLGAACCALLILALVVVAWRRAFRNRAPQPLLLDTAGLTVGGTHLPWSALAGRRVELPAANRHAAATGIHSIAAAIAARQQAAETRVMQDRRDGTPPLLLAGGLDAGTAERLRAALDTAAARYPQ
jgi:predicted lipid-binding transport protein (Tim44 family)